MRRGVEAEQYYFVRGWGEEHSFARDALWHLLEPDINQELCLSALLNESAPLFRRRYYLNGPRVGFILYGNDAAQNLGYIDAMREALKSAKWPGNTILEAW